MPAGYQEISICKDDQGKCSPGTAARETSGSRAGAWELEGAPEVALAAEPADPLAAELSVPLIDSTSTGGHIVVVVVASRSSSSSSSNNNNSY